jgi:pimeloyl-ACP methyl ester carboxylesterase
MSLPSLPFQYAELLPQGTERKTINIDDQVIHYLERGTGTPVFMMHGNPTWSFLYRNIMSGLDPEQYRCIVPDLVGLGLSSKPGNSFHTLEKHQDIMTKFLNTVLTEDFIFVGQDWGGPIGLLASMHCKFKLLGMVLMNTSILPPKPNFKPTTFHAFSRIPIISDLVFRVFQFPQRYLGSVQGDRNSIAGTVRQAYIWPLTNIANNNAPLILARMVPNSLDHPSVAWLKKTTEFARTFKGPVALVWGKMDPILGRLVSAHQKLMPHASVELTDGGHFIQEEYPKLIVEAIKKVSDAGKNT